MRNEIVKFELFNEMDLVLAHKRAIQLGEITGLSTPDRTRFATAVSEIGRNCIEYAKEGYIMFCIVNENEVFDLEAIIIDEGEGIEDLEEIMSRSEPTSRGRGMGMVYSKKLVDHFKIDTSKKGTRVYLRKRIPAKHPPINKLIIEGWAEHFRKEVPVSPYEEIKKRNIELLEIAEKLRTEKFMVEFQMMEIKRLNSELQKSNADLKEFAYAISHDLKNPLAALKMRVALFREAQSEEDRTRNFEGIENSVDRLESTIRGLIEIIDVRGKKETAAKTIDLVSLLETVENEYEYLLEGKRGSIMHHLEVRKITYIEGYIKSILTNVISNSIKYSSPDRELEIHIDSKRENEFVVLTVRDNGIGMDLEKDAKNLFKPFSRLTRTAEGKGIGLYIIKNMVENNGGKVSVASKPGNGTEFRFYLKEYAGE